MIFVDTHVHIYNRFDLNVFMASAVHHFELASNTVVEPSSFVLLLSESQNLNYFSRLKEYALHQRKEHLFGKGFDSFKIETIDHQSEALRVYDAKGASMYIMAGRQIITKEKLEVLALFTNSVFEDGLPMETVIQSVLDLDAIPVLPWSPGKWFGERGTVIKNIIENKTISTLFLGDIFSRPSFYTEPLFQLAEKNQIRILAGSDPLPLPGEEKRAGCFMSAIPGQLENDAPVTHLKEIMKASEIKITNWGQQTSIFSFFKNQILLRLAKQKSNL